MNLIRCILGNNDCFKAGKLITPKGVMIHSTGANNPNLRRYVQPMVGSSDYKNLLTLLGTNSNGNDWNRSGLAVCVHGFVGRLAGGSIASVQCLPWDMRGWHAGKGRKGSANNTHIGFEICEDGLEDKNYFQKVYREAVELTAMLCKQYNLDPMEEGVVICHSEGYKLGIASNHGDVMHWFSIHGKTMDEFRKDVLLEMEGEEMTQDQFNKMMDAYLEQRAAQDPSKWSEADRKWAEQAGVVQGTGKRMEYKAFVTKEEAVAMIHRAVT